MYDNFVLFLQVVRLDPIVKGWYLATYVELIFFSIFLNLSKVYVVKLHELLKKKNKFKGLFYFKLG